MKKVILFTAMLCGFFSVSNAQISKGSVLLGGGISASRGKSESNGTKTGKSTGIGFNPSLGFVVKDNQVFGINAGYGRGKSEYQNSPDSKYNGYNAGAFFRKYLSLGKSFYLFGEAGAGYYRSRSESGEVTSNNTKSIQSQSTFGLSIFPGVTYAVGKRFHLECSINNLVSLSYYTNKQQSISTIATVENENEGISFNANVSSATPLTLGFRFVLGK